MCNSVFASCFYALLNTFSVLFCCISLLLWSPSYGLVCECCCRNKAACLLQVRHQVKADLHPVKTCQAAKKPVVSSGAERNNKQWGLDSLISLCHDGGEAEVQTTADGGADQSSVVLRGLNVLCASCDPLHWTKCLLSGRHRDRITKQAQAKGPRGTQIHCTSAGCWEQMKWSSHWFINLNQ